MASRTTTDPIEILLEMGVDLDNLSEEEDYLSALKEAIATIQFQTKGGGDERSAILSQEVIRVRKQRKAADSKFKARKTKISAGALKKGSATGTNLAPKALPGSAIVSYQKPEAEEKKEEKKKGSSKNLILEISETVTRIADILKDQYKLKRDTATFDRKKAEREKRDLQKKNLAKRFEGLKKVAQKIIAPVKGIFDRIMGFLFNIILGKFLIKLVEWFSNPDNQSKIKSIIRFLTDNWPKLLSAYIVFGTGLGKFSRFLVKILARGAVRLAAATTGLLARLFGSRALGKFSRFFGKRGRLIAGGIEAVTTIVAFKALEDAFTKGIAPEKSASIDNDIPISGYQGGGLVQPIFKFNGGGPVKFNLLDPRTWMSGKGQEAVRDNTKRYKPNSLGGRLLNRRNATNEAIREMRGYEEGGEVDGPGGIDKVPAMLTDGEFVMSRGAVHKYGLSQLESMNAAGGGTNKPKIMNGMVYAVGGGGIGAYFNEVKERYVLGDKSLLNRLAHDDRKGALEALGIKVDENTKAAKENTKQRRADSKQRSEDIYTVEELIAGAVGIAQSLEQQAAGLYDQAMSGAAQLIDQSVVLAEHAQQVIEGIPEQAHKLLKGTLAAAESANPLPGLGRDLERRGSQPSAEEIAIAQLTKERIASGQLGPDGKGLTKDTQEALKNHDNYIRSLYASGHMSNDPSIERNAVQKFLDQSAVGRGLQNVNADIQNRGLLPDLLAPVKTASSDKFFEFLSGGRLKNMGATLTGMQTAAKGMTGPLGRMFRIDDMGSLGRYARASMEHAQSLGISGVGNNEFFNRKSLDDAPNSANMYDKLLPNKIANLALGQFNFKVGKDGRAVVTDDYDASTLSAEEYHQKSRKELVNIGKVLQGKGDPNKDPFSQIAGGLMEAYKMHGSAQLAAKQNLGQSNLRPLGLDIRMGDGFIPDKPKVTKEERQSFMNRMMGGKDAYYSSTTGMYYKNYAEALKDPRIKAAAQVEEFKKKLSFSSNQQPNLTIPGMPTNASGSNVTVVKAPAKSTDPKLNGSGSEVPSRPPGNGDPAKFRIFGIPIF